MKRTKIKLMVLSMLSLVGMFAAVGSAGACWVWSYYQRECPKSLLK